MIRETLQTAPATEPVTLSDAKAHIRKETTEDDALITSLITVARKTVEDKTGRALITQTWDFFFDQFPTVAPYEIKLPRGFCQSVTHVKYLDSEGDEQTLVVDVDYQVSKSGDTGARIKPIVGAAWGSAKTDTYEAVRIRAVVGWNGAANVPSPIIHACKLIVAHFYENREASIVGTTAIELPIGARALLAPYTLLNFA